jgi:hypothetical protein
MGKSSSTRQTNLFGVSTLFIFIIIFVSCAKINKLSDINPELEIAKEINKRKIVILGEQPHRHPSGYNEVIKILYEWLGECRRTKNTNASLNLVLEIHTSWTNQLNEFFETGNLSPFLDTNINLVTLEEVEFYIKLKNFYDSVKYTNKNEGYNIKFKTLGFEEDFNNSPDYCKKTMYQVQYWFVKERDSVIVQKFLQYYNDNTTDNYLFYYGLFHLQKGLVNKNPGGLLVDKDSCMGYCLAGYLKNKLGEENVITIAKIMTSPDKLKELKLDTLINEKFFTDGKDFRVEIFRKPQYDFIFFNPYTDITDHPFNLVFSKKVFEKALEELTKLEKNLPENKIFVLWKTILTKLSYLAGVKFKDSKDLKKWIENQKSFDISYFDSNEYRNKLFQIYSNDEENVKAKIFLRQFGFEKSIEEYNSMDTAEWNNKLWPEAIKNIKIINAIGIFWAGYPDEKIKAKEYLKNINGQDFAEPEKYLQWWRNVYHNYGIE